MIRITAEFMQMNLSGTTVMLVAGVALLMIVMTILSAACDPARAGANARRECARA